MFWNVPFATLLSAFLVPAEESPRGNLDPDAISCENEIPDSACGELMGEKYAPQCASRPQNCYTYPTQVTRMCSKTYVLCCENPNYNCEGRPNFAPLCPLWKASCGGFGDQVTGAMAFMCPKTCGLCGCAYNAYMCKDFTSLGVWVRNGYPKTCGLCGAEYLE